MKKILFLENMRYLLGMSIRLPDQILRVQNSISEYSIQLLVGLDTQIPPIREQCWGFQIPPTREQCWGFPEINFCRTDTGLGKTVEERLEAKFDEHFSNHGPRIDF